MFGDTSLSGQETVWLTFLGAGFGSFLAVALQAWLTRRGSKDHFRAMLGAVLAEIEMATALAAERSDRPMWDLRFDGPYATSAWGTLASSAEVRRLGKAYPTLANFYAEVDAANHRLEQVSALARTSATSPSEAVAQEYRNIAQSFSSEGQKRVAELGSGCSAVVTQVLNGRSKR